MIPIKLLRGSSKSLANGINMMKEKGINTAIEIDTKELVQLTYKGPQHITGVPTEVIHEAMLKEYEAITHCEYVYVKFTEGVYRYKLIEPIIYHLENKRFWNFLIPPQETQQLYQFIKNYKVI